MTTRTVFVVDGPATLPGDMIIEEGSKAFIGKVGDGWESGDILVDQNGERYRYEGHEAPIAPEDES